MTEAQIRETFRYHSPSPAAVAQHEAIRERMTETVVDVAMRIPDSAERDQFVRLMQLAQMSANAAIAVHGLRPADD